MPHTEIQSIPFSLDKKLIFKHIIYFILLFVAIFIGLKQYLFFHTFVELFSVIISFMISVIAANTYEINKGNKLIFLGMAFGFVGFFDILHLLTSEGIRLFDYETHNITTQLWVTARYIQSISFLISLTPITRKIKTERVIFSYSAISLVVLLSIFYFEDYPICFIKGQGMTPFKIISEFIICAIICITIYFTLKDRKKNNNNNKTSRLIILGLIAFLFSELFFSTYISVDDIYNIIGHTLKFISCYFIYLALIKTSLKEPYNYLVKINSLFTDKNRDLENAMLKLKTEYDIMEHRNEEINRKSEILNAILETSINGILVIGHDEKVIYYNNKLLEMLNLDIEINKGTLMNEIEYKLAQNINNPEEMLSATKEVRNFHNIVIQNLYFKDGKVIEASNVPFFDDGMNKGILTIFSNITDRMKIIELEKDIQIKQATIEKAKEYDELKNIFLSTVAHEFRTPLTVILGTLQLIEGVRDTVECPNHPMINNYISLMRQNCYRLVKLTNNLIDINKIDMGYFDIELKNNDIISIIENITLSVAEYIKNKDLTLVFDTDVEEKIMACDSYLMERVMLNLLSNSVKCTEKGGEIKVNVYDKGDTVVISVKDNGVGIPKDKADIIFDRFRQVDTSLKRKFEGSGIGLALVKVIIEQHGGSIRLNTDLECGTEFIIELPVRIVDDRCICELYIPKKTNIERISIEFADIYDI